MYLKKPIIMDNGHMPVKTRQLRAKLQRFRKVFQFTNNLAVFVSRLLWSCTPGGGGTQQNFIRGGSAPRSNPLPFYISFLIEKVPLASRRIPWDPSNSPPAAVRCKQLGGTVRDILKENLKT